MSSAEFNVAINDEFVKKLLSSLPTPLKLYHSDYMNFDPISFAGDVSDFEVIDSEDHRLQFVQDREATKRVVDSITTDSNATRDLEATLKTLIAATTCTYREYLDVAKFTSLEVHYMDIYLKSPPKVSFLDGKIEIADLVIRLDFKVTGHFKLLFGRKHIDLQSRGVDIQTTGNVALDVLGSKLFATLGLDRLKLVLDFGIFKFTFDLLKYIKPKMPRFEVFNAATAVIAIPSASSTLVVKGLSATVTTGMFTVKTDLDVIA